MAETRAQRTLVKSPPELWAEISDVSALARHLGEFGEIRITRLEPESAVAWEGDRARGTVQLEPAGWGTKVTLTAEMPDEPDGGEASDEAVADEAAAAGASPPEGGAEAVEPAPEPVPDPAPEPDAAPAPISLPTPEPEPPPAAAAVSVDGEPRRGFFARLFGGRRRKNAEEGEAAKEEAAKAGIAVDAEVSPVEEPPPDDGGEDLRPPESLSLTTVEEVVVEAAPSGLDPERAEVILTGVLDDLGSARHRPFSRG